MRVSLITCLRSLAIALLVVINGYNIYVSVQPDCTNPSAISSAVCAVPMQWQTYIAGISTGADFSSAVAMILFMPRPIRRALKKLFAP
jgi:hypothetical protein